MSLSDTSIESMPIPLPDSTGPNSFTNYADVPHGPREWVRMAAPGVMVRERGLLAVLSDLMDKYKPGYVVISWQARADSSHVLIPVTSTEELLRYDPLLHVIYDVEVAQLIPTAIPWYGPTGTWTSPHS